MQDEQPSEASMTDHSELIERLLDPTPPHYGKCLAAATAIRDLIAERDAAHAKGWNEAIEAGAGFAEQLYEGYREGFDKSERGTRIYEELRVQAGTARHIAAAIRAMRKDTPQ